MARELNEENLKEGYCKVLACTGIGAAEKDCDGVLPELVKKAVPASMQDDYPTRLLACANQVCTSEPYVWGVDQTEPGEITDETTFQDLYDSWFLEIVSPV